MEIIYRQGPSSMMEELQKRQAIIKLLKAERKVI